jgi:hypothetical protein
MGASAYLMFDKRLGRCSFEAGRKHVNVRNVIWLGTANIGHELVFEHQLERSDPESPMSRQEYIGLVELFRPDVSKCLGVSCQLLVDCFGVNLVLIDNFKLSAIAALPCDHRLTVHTIHY